eukprot:1153162-Pelagomonas_calceolata.AAC.1
MQHSRAHHAGMWELRKRGSSQRAGGNDCEMYISFTHRFAWSGTTSPALSMTSTTTTGSCSRASVDRQSLAGACVKPPLATHGCTVVS